MTDPYRIAFVDIETAPNLAYVWGKWQQDVVEFAREWYILTFSCKWAHRKPITYGLPDFPLYKRDPENDRDIIKKLWACLDEADLIVGHNLDQFDVKKINARFLLHGLPPPSPYKTVDTKKLAKRYFGFNSNRLNDICKALGMGEKVKTDFSLWLGCMRGDELSWQRMKRYNAHDVVLTEKVYERLRGWDGSHPNITLKSGKSNLCPACGSGTQSRGWRNLKSFRARLYWCLNPLCHKWSTGEREKLTATVLS